MQRRIVVASFGLIVGLVIAGCSTGSSPTSAPLRSVESTSTAPSPPASSVAVPSGVDLTAFLPAGTYTADIPSGLEAGPGRWLMTVSRDGITWTNPNTGSTFSPGPIIGATASTITFGPDPACPDQDAGATEGSYDWRLEDGALRFALQSDSCAGRRDTLATAPWTPAP